MERERVLAITGPGGRGSGYLIAPRLVLTSAHVAKAADTALSVFRPGYQGTFTAEALWCGTPGGRDDAALVLVTDIAWDPLPGPSVVWGRTVTYQPGIPCQTWGRPAIAQREGRPTDTAQLTGTLNPGTRLTSDRYLLDLDSFPPAGESPWAGLSGAVVFCGDLLAGVIAVDPAGLQHASLEAVPAYVILQDPGFVAALTEHAGVESTWWEAIELQSINDPMARTVIGEPVRSPAALLTARRAVVPFHGREELLAELHSWASQPEFGVWLLHGPGGQGKTRLAHEFVDQLRQEGWAAVWLPASADVESVREIAAVRTSTAVVVDYAENGADRLTAVFTALARVAPDVSVKVLLLARTAGAWWEELAATGGETVRDIVDLAQVRALPVLDSTPEARQVAYHAAVAAFAAALSSVGRLSGHSWPAIAASLLDPTPPMLGGTASTVLAVQMTALADLLDSVSDQAPRRAGERGPEDRVLDHERGYWKSAATARGLFPGFLLETLTDVVIATAILRPSTVDGIDAVLARVPGMDGQPADRRDAVRAWLTSVYPPSRGGVFEGLVPDRLAERLVGRSFLDVSRPCVVERLAPRVNEDEAVRLLTVCTRAAAHTVLATEVGERVTRCCVEYPDQLMVAAVQVAAQVEAPAPLIRAIDNFVSADRPPDAPLLESVASRFPERSEALVEVAVKITTRLVDHRRQALSTKTQSGELQLAHDLNSLSNRLSDLGRSAEALAAIGEAVAIYRSLNADKSTESIYRLSVALNNLANRLAEAQRNSEALDAISESVALYWPQVVRDQSKLTPRLSHLMYNLSNSLDATGRHEESLQICVATIALRRRFAKMKPEVYLSDLAASLNSLCLILGHLGRHNDALDAIYEAVQVWRELFNKRPDAFGFNLADSLNNLSACLGILNRSKEGLRASVEAVDILRELHERRPEMYQSHLVNGLVNLSLHLEMKGDREASQKIRAEALELDGG